MLALNTEVFLKGPALWRPEAGGCSSGWSWRDIPLNFVSQCLLWSGARQRRKSGTDTQIVYITKMLRFKRSIQSKNSMRSMCEVIFLGRWRKRRKDGDAEITCTKSWGLQSEPTGVESSNVDTKCPYTKDTLNLPLWCWGFPVKVSLEKACCNSGDSVEHWYGRMPAFIHLIESDYTQDEVQVHHFEAVEVHSDSFMLLFIKSSVWN